MIKLPNVYVSEKNRVWTLCQTALQMATMAMEEAERLKLTDSEFYIAFEDALNLISVKDHSNNSEIEDFAQHLNSFYADSE